MQRIETRPEKEEKKPINEEWEVISPTKISARPGSKPSTTSNLDDWETVDLSTHGKPQREVSEKEGFTRGIVRDVGGGLADLAEMYGRGIRALPGGAEAGRGEGIGGKIITSAKDIKKQYDLEPKERTGISRWIHGGVRAATTSLAAGVPGALAGIAATSWVPLPGARVAGAIFGYAVGGATLFGIAEYDSTMEEALSAGIAPEKAEAAAIRNGLFEGGLEFAANILEGLTIGAGRVVTTPAKAALKNGITSMFKVGAKQALKRGVGVAAIETGSEMLTAGLQTEEYYKLGLTKQRFYDAAIEAFGPAFVASIIFGGMAEGGLQLNRRKIEKTLKDPDAKPQERMAIVDEVYKKILPVDKDMAEQWKDSATESVKNGEAISTDEAFEGDKELEGAIEDRELVADKMLKQEPKVPTTAKDVLTENETDTKISAKEMLVGEKTTEAESIEAEEAAAAFSDEALAEAIEGEGIAEEPGKPELEPVVGEGKAPEVSVAELETLAEKRQAKPSDEIKKPDKKIVADLPKVVTVAEPSTEKEGVGEIEVETARKKPWDMTSEERKRHGVFEYSDPQSNKPWEMTKEERKAERKRRRNMGEKQLPTRKDMIYDAYIDGTLQNKDATRYGFAPLEKQPIPLTDKSYLVKKEFRDTEFVKNIPKIAQALNAMKGQYEKQVKGLPAMIGEKIGSLIPFAGKISKASIGWHLSHAYTGTGFEFGSSVGSKNKMQQIIDGFLNDPYKFAKDDFFQTKTEWNQFVKDEYGLSSALEMVERGQEQVERIEHEASPEGRRESFEVVSAAKPRPPKSAEAKPSEAPEATIKGEGIVGVAPKKTKAKKIIPEAVEKAKVESIGKTYKKTVPYKDYIATVTSYVKRADNKNEPNQYQVYHFTEYSHSENTYDELYSSYKTLEDANKQIRHEKDSQDDESVKPPLIRYNGKKANGFAETTVDIEIKKRNHPRSKHKDYAWEKERDPDNEGKFRLVGRLKEADTAPPVPEQKVDKPASEMTADEMLVEWDKQVEEIEPTAKEKATEAKAHLSKAMDAFSAINDILGEKGALTNEVNEDKWLKIKPLLKTAFDEIIAAGKSGADFVSIAIKNLGPKGKPYFEKFIKEEKGKEVADVADHVRGRKPRETEKADDRGISGVESTKVVPETKKRDVSEPVRKRLGKPVDEGVQRKDIRAKDRILKIQEKPKEPDSAGSRAGNVDKKNLGRDSGHISGLQRADYRIKPGTLKREGSWKDAAKNNLDAIELLKKITEEKRPATPKEQKILAKYVGWGASDLANNMFPGYAQYGTIRENWAASQWQSTVERLVKLLTPAEIKSAAKSTQYAHYTNEPIIKSIYNTLDKMGFDGGRILEPGMGIGNFVGLLPTEMRKDSNYTGIEMDAISAGIAKLLYPNQNMLQADFIQQAFPKNFFDAAIGNPPFGSTKILSDPEYRKHRFSLHNFFFAKTIDRVRPGGLLVFVTSRYTMDAKSDKARSYIAGRADLLGAIRLPQTAFLESAGTEVVTDVLFLQKRNEGEKQSGKSWAGQKEIMAGDGKALINEYFVTHPEMILGKNSLESSMYGPEQYTVAPFEGKIEHLFVNAAKNLPSNIYKKVQETTASTYKEQSVIERDFDPKNKKEGGIYVSDSGQVMKVDFGSGVAIDKVHKKITIQAKELLKGYIRLRDALKLSHKAQLENGNWEQELKNLNKEYTAFVGKHGNVLAYTTAERTKRNEDGTTEKVEYRRLKNEAIFGMDCESSLLLTLEQITEDGKIVKSKVLLNRTINKPTVARIETVPDALAVSLNSIGKLDIAHVAKTANKSTEEVIATLGDLVYENPDGSGQVLADEYLSGNVVLKLAEAKLAAKTNPDFERNVSALEKAQPEPLEPKHITITPGATWIPLEYYSQFADEVLAIPMAQINYQPIDNSWEVLGDFSAHGLRGNINDWSTEDRGVNEIFDSVLNNRTIRIMRTTYEGETKRTVLDADATAAVNDIVKKIRGRFNAWAWEDKDRAGSLLNIYNTKINVIKGREFDGSHLTLPGMSQHFTPYDYQKRVIWRILQTGNTYLAHAVGSGKTLVMIAAGMEMRRLGMINKPLYVVPKHMLGQFAQEFQELYPMSNVLVADEKNFHTENRRRFMAQATLNDPDAIILTHSSFGMIGVKEETLAPVRNEFLEQMRYSLSEMKDEGESKMLIKRMEKRIEQAEQRFNVLIASGDRAISFEEFGADYLFVDECHSFRKLDFATNRKIKGIDPQGSKMSIDLYIKTMWLERQSKGRSHSFASGTPIVNTLGELYTLQRFFDSGEMEADGINHFDAWANMFGQPETTYEPNAAGTYEPVERFSKFVNMPELMSRIRMFMDVLTSSQLGTRVIRPKIKGGSPDIILAPQSDILKKYQQEVLTTRIKASREWKPSPGQPGNPDPIINIITDGRLSSIDMRFVDKKAKDNPDSKLNKYIDGIIETFFSTKDMTFAMSFDSAKKAPVKGGVQICFYNSGFGKGVIKRRGFDSKAFLMKRLKDAGIEASDVAWIDDYKTASQKQALFKLVRSGEKRILLGSAKKMGTGLNVQNRLTHLHYLDAPWYPADVEQPDGRIIRQGNQNKEVSIVRYATKGSYDETLWRMVARKSKFIEQAFTGDKSARSIEDISESSQYEMAAALASGDKRVVQLAVLRADIERLYLLEGAYRRTQAKIKYERPRVVSDVASNKRRIEEFEETEALFPEFIGSKIDAKVGRKKFTERKELGASLISQIKKLFAEKSEEYVKLGVISGMDINASPVSKELERLEIELLVGEFTITVDNTYMNTKDWSAVDPIGLTKKITNTINGLPSKKREAEKALGEKEDRLVKIDKKIGVPFEYEQELLEKVSESATLEQEIIGISATEEEIRAAGKEEPIFLKRKTATAYGKFKAPTLQSKIDQITTLWKNAPQVEVVQSQPELPGGILQYVPTGEIVDGAYSNGRVYLVADNLSSIEKVVTTLIHESFGHYGPQKFLGNDFKVIMQDVFIAKRQEVQKIAEEYGYDTKTLSGREMASGEWLAREATSKPESSWIKRVMATIRSFARRILPSLKLSDAEILQIIEGSRKHIEKGQIKAGTLFEDIPLFQMAGKKAIGADKGALAKAQKMLSEGKDKKEIWRETGWLKGAEKEDTWKFEIDDSGAKLSFPNNFTDTKDSSEGKKIALSSIMEHPALYKAYPNIKNLTIVPSQESYYDETNNEIYLERRSDIGEVKESLFHEIQHAIQKIEGFAKGGSVETFDKEKNRMLSWLEKAVTLYDEQLKEYDNEKHKKQYLLATSGKTEALGLLKNAVKIDTYKQYKYLAGEIEARDTALRAKLTPGQRREQLPYESQGIPEDQWIITKGGGTSFSVEPKKEKQFQLKDGYKDLLAQHAKMEKAKVPGKPTPAFLKRKPTEEIDTTGVFSPEVEKRMAAAKGGPKVTFKEKLKETLTEIKHQKHHFPDLQTIEDKTLRAKVNDTLRRHQEVPEVAKNKAIQLIHSFTKNLPKGGYNVYRMEIILADMERDIKNGLTYDGKLPFGFKTVAEVKESRAKLQAIIKQHPEISKALKKRSDAINKIKKDLVKGKLLKKETLKDDDYFHHQIIQYWEKKYGMATGSKDVRTSWRPWMAARKGSPLDYNTDYIEAEFTAISQQLAQLGVVKTLGQIKKDADIYVSLKIKAKALNIANLTELFKKRGLIEKDSSGKDKDVLLPWKQKIAVANSNLESLAHDNQLSYDSEWQGIVDKLKQSYLARKSKDPMERLGVGVDDARWFNFLSYLVNTNKPGAISAATVFKAVKGRDEFIKTSLGENFRTYSNVIPKGYTEWKPSPDKGWFWANVITDKILERIQKGELDPNDVEARKLLSKGRDITWVIPEGLAATMDKFKGQIEPSWVGNVADTAMQRWKQYILLNPYSVIRYNLNNTSGDLDACLAYSPEIATKYAWKAFKDLWRWHKKKSLPDVVQKEIDEAHAGGAIQSGFSMQEVDSVKEILSMDKFVKDVVLDKNPNWFTKAEWYGIKKAGTKYWSFVRRMTALRENTLRLAAYRFFLDNKDKRLYGASNPTEVDAISDPKEKAAKLARELLGDYGNISKSGEYMRKRIMPFYSWLEINAPRYVYLMRNTKYENREVDSVKKQMVAVAGKKLVLSGAKLAMRASMLMGAVMLWNMTVFPDEEEELGETGRQQAHIILGRREDGSIITLRFQGALSDALSFFALEDWPADMKDLLEGKRTVGEKLKEIPLALLNRGVQAIRPEPKLMGELISGKSFYPDVMRPLPIRDRVEHALRTFKLDKIYRVALERPARGKDPEVSRAVQMAEHFVGDLKSLLLYESDPGLLAYYDTRQAVFGWLAKQGDEKRYGGRPTKKGNAFYYYKQAMKYGDLDAAQRYLKKYYSLGGTPRSKLQSMKYAHPLSSISAIDRIKFRRSLSDAQQDKVKRALIWYHKTYR